MLSILAFTSLIAGIGALPARLVVPSTDRRATCPKDLGPPSAYEFPHLIIPISKTSPDTCYPNSYSGTITPGDIATVFNYDMHDGNCELNFFFPTQAQLLTSSFEFSGPGTFTFDVSVAGTGAVEGQTDWNYQPPSANYPGFPKTITMQPGNVYSLGAGTCTPGLAALTISSPDSTLKWFQDFNPCPIGPFSLYT